MELTDIYRALPIQADEQIRLITITPGDIDDPLDFSMGVEYFWEADYTALSYRWMGVDNEKMGINGVPVNNVRTNLHTCLRYLRASINRPQKVWFDAFCIDQASSAEKGEQLLLMGEIYANARRTIVWLGPPTLSSISALNHFSQVDERSLKGLLDRYDKDKDKWLDFGDGLMDREWWGRAWMVQEMVCAKSLVFMCGEQQMDLEQFMPLINFILSSGRPCSRIQTSPEFQFRQQAFLEMFVARTMWKSGGAPLEIAPWVYKFHSWGATEPQDRILAYLGLAFNYRGDLGTIPWRKLYLETTVHILEDSGFTDFICLGRGLLRDSSLPSWVPDLSIPYSVNAKTPPLWCGWENQRKKDFGLFKASSIKLFEGSVHRNQLTIKSMRVGRIETIGTVHQEGNDSVAEARQLAFGSRPLKPYTYQPIRLGDVPTVTCEDALGRTLIWDLNYMEDRCSSSQGFFKDEARIPPLFLEDYKGDPTGRNTSWKAQVDESRIKFRLGRRFAIVSSKVGDLYAMVPPDTSCADAIFILSGATVPMVFRPVTGSSEHFKLVGPCYTHGIMDGEIYHDTLWNGWENEVDIIIT